MDANSLASSTVMRFRLPQWLVAVVSPLFLAMAAHGDLIPPVRLVNWTPGVNVGVPGGINQYLPRGAHQRTSLIDVTQAPYNADKTGVADAFTAIQAAVDAATAGQVVYLPAGTYRLNSPIHMNAGRSNITVRGAGPSNTFIDCRSNSGFNVISNSDYSYVYPASNNIVTAGLTKNSTVLTIADTSPFSVGHMVMVAFQNQWDNAAIQAGAVPVVPVGYSLFLRSQVTSVTAKTGTTLTIFPGLYNAPDAGLSAKVTVFQVQCNGIGIEDMSINGTNGTILQLIEFEQSYGCWVKNVKTSNTTNYHIYFADSSRCEVRHCTLDNRLGGGSNGAGLLVNNTSASLFEDNIVSRNFPNVEVNQGSCGNVFAYNLFEDSRVFGFLGGNIDSNHGAHNSFNLYEGNIVGNFECDGYFGSASEDTIFRNWITGTIYDGSLQSFIITLKRFTRKYSIVGNILGNSGTPNTPGSQYSFGQPNIGNGNSTGTAQPSAGIFWTDWPTMKAGGNPGPAGFQELDLDVQLTTILKGNYFVPAAAIPAGEALGGDTLGNSMFRSSKPAYFNSLAWPPFNPLSPGTLSYDLIPAGYRYVHATDPPGGPPEAPTNLRIGTPRAPNPGGSEVQPSASPRTKARGGQKAGKQALKTEKKLEGN